MEQDINTSTVVTLKLNMDEAKWLRGLMQNPLLRPDEALGNEPSKDHVMRSNFWNALPDFDELVLPASGDDKACAVPF
jgi:hypothetical protein